MTLGKLSTSSALALLIAACGRVPANNAAADAPAPAVAPATNDVALAPPAVSSPANEAAPADTPPAPASLAAYAGKYPFDEVGGITFLAHPRVRAAVGAAVPDRGVRAWIFERAGPQTPIGRQNGRLLSWGCEAHNCGDHNWTIFIDDAGSAAEICYHDQAVMGGSSRWYRAGNAPETREQECPSE